MTLAHDYDCFLLDLDGTLYLDGAVLPGAVQTVARLRGGGKRVAFMTNNSSRTRSAVSEKLSSLGFSASPDEVVTSGWVTARLLAARRVPAVFVLGGSGLRNELEEAGVRVLEEETESAPCVVVGMDTSANYEKLKRAALLVQRGAGLIATNDDGAFPTSHGLWPGAGALLAVVTTTTGVAPEVIGKPNPAIFEAARELAGGGRPLVVGDRLDTDILGAGRLGWDSLLVLTGISDRGMVSDAEVKPTFVGDGLSILSQDPPPVPRA